MVGVHQLFFFFQAEDGIRDYKVTGVQTCALPIWEERMGNIKRGIPAIFSLAMPGPLWARGDVWLGMAAVVRGIAVTAAQMLIALARSEERRVGKEGRSRWWPYH